MILQPVVKLFRRLVEKFFEMNMTKEWSERIPGLIVECCELFPLAMQSNKLWNIRLSVIQEFSKVLLLGLLNVTDY